MKTINRSDYQSFVNVLERNLPTVRVCSSVYIEPQYRFVTYRVLEMLLQLDGVIGINIEHIVTTDDGPPTLYFYVVDADFNYLIKVYDLTHQLFWMAYESRFEALEFKPIDEIEVNWL